MKIYGWHLVEIWSRLEVGQITIKDMKVLRIPPYLYSTVSWIQTDPNNTENPCGRECVRTPNGALTAKYKAQWRCWRCHTLKQAYRINKASQAWRSFLIVQLVVRVARLGLNPPSQGGPDARALAAAFSPTRSFGRFEHRYSPCPLLCQVATQRP